MSKSRATSGIAATSEPDRAERLAAADRPTAIELARRELILMGPPGSGKGTQARLLAGSPGWVHLATGDLFREHLRRGTAVGKLADQHLAKGQYVPDDVTVGMVRERLAEIAPGVRIVFDGFPRTVRQAEALDELLAAHGRGVDRVILLEVPRDQLVDRLGSRKEHRSDDSPEVVRKRLEVFDEQTRPVIEHYERKGLLRRVAGLGGVDAVRARVDEALSSPRSADRGGEGPTRSSTAAERGVPPSEVGDG